MRSTFGFESLGDLGAGGEEATKEEMQTKLSQIAQATRQSHGVLQIAAKARQMKCALAGLEEAEYKCFWPAFRRELAGQEPVLDRLLKAVRQPAAEDVLKQVGEETGAVEGMLEKLEKVGQIQPEGGTSKSLELDVLPTVPISLKVSTQVPARARSIASPSCFVAGRSVPLSGRLHAEHAGGRELCGLWRAVGVDAHAELPADG